MLALGIMVAAQLSASWLDAYPKITPQTAAQRVASCGAGAATVRSDEELDTDVLVINGSSSLSEEQLVCIDKGASFYDVELPPSVQPRFNAIREARSAALMATEGRKWLKAHHLLDRLPGYTPGVTDDAVYAQKIAKLCKADGALQSRYGSHALSPDWVMQRRPDAFVNDGRMACLLNVTWATGFKMGIIGNELAAPK